MERNLISDLEFVGRTKLQRGEGFELEEERVDQDRQRKTQADFKQSNRQDSGYGSESISDEDEDDVIIAGDTKLEVLKEPPGDVDIKFLDTKVQSKKRTGIQVPGNAKYEPDEKSEIFVNHPLKTEDESGDRFGAKLCTYDRTKKSRFYRHYLKGIEKQTPAVAMFIKDKDELVKINNVFVPEKSHNEVLDIFSHIPVDGETRLCLVIRRQNGLWIKTSAILVPEGEERAKAERVQKEGTEPPSRITMSKHRFEIEGLDKYLSIDRSGVCAKPNHGADDTTTVMHTKVTYTLRGDIEFDVALSNSSNDVQLAIVNDGDVRAETTSELRWLKPDQMGSDFKFSYKGLYLCFCISVGKFRAVKENEFREEDTYYRTFHDAGSSLDVTDSASSQSSKTQSLSSSCSSRRSLDNMSIPSSEEETEGHRDNSSFNFDIMSSAPLTKPVKTPTTPLECLSLSSVDGD